jgi:putative membrane protein
MKTSYSKIILATGYLIGIVGLYMKRDQPEYFQLSWAFTVVTFAILLFHQEKHTVRTYIGLLLVGLSGWFVEAMGTNTGLIFGDYTYGHALGFSLWNTPLAMAVNWMLTTYLVVMVLKDRIKNTYYFTVTAAAFMVFYDVLLEPFAIRFDLWSWAAGTPPISNYLGWFVVSLPLVYLLRFSLKENSNPLAAFVLVCQVVFFGVMNLLVGYFD